MADKSSRVSGIGLKPVPMKLFATWEVEKSSPNCIPRLCSLTLTRIIVPKPLENELQSVIIAVKMQNSKRVLRSNEIIMAPNGMLDTELDLSFSLQYPHFLKRDGNKLQIMIQRRKKYKNRTILGYKTLAMGQVSMAQVLQRSVDKELSLYSDLKDRSTLVARVVMLSLTSQPVDHDDNGHKKLRSSDADRSPDGENSEDDEPQDDPADYSSNDDLSDSDTAGNDDRATRVRRFMKMSMGRQQRNIKQKFVALLRKFRVSEEVLDSEQDQDLGDEQPNQQDIEDLFDELENLSESDPEMDTISVLSTPKPKLRPFFTGKGSNEAVEMQCSQTNGVPKDTGRLSDEGSIKKLDSDTNVDNLSEDELDIVACNPTQLLPQTPPSLRSEQTEVCSFYPGDDLPHIPLQTGTCDLPNTTPPLLVAASDTASCSSSSPSRHNNTTTSSPPTPPPPSSTASVKPHLPKTIRDFQELSPKLKREKVKRFANVKSNSFEVVEQEPRKALLDQLSKILSSSDDSLPESLVLVCINEWQGKLLTEALTDPKFRVLCTSTSADVKAIISAVVNKIQKFCNTNSRAPAPMKIAVAGSDRYVNSIMWPYVEQFSAKSPDWQHYIKFLVIPLGVTTLGKHLGQADTKYNSMFNDTAWIDTFEKSENTNSSQTDMSELCSRIEVYLTEASQIVQVPIAEAMLTYCKERDKGEEETSQIFVPFLSEVKVGPIDISGMSASSVDVEEPSIPQSVYMSSSPPQSSSVIPTPAIRDNHTPPNSPNVSISQPPLPQGHNPPLLSPPPGSSPPVELIELQVDYWTLPSKSEFQEKTDKLVKKDSKASLKTTFRSILVYRLPTLRGYTGEQSAQSLNLVMVTKEKKQKIMRIGKKSKDPESKSQLIESVQRLVCTTKSQSQPITVSIDGVDWLGVKFFQISSLWQTHIKYFPVLIFGHEMYTSDTGL